MYMTYMCVHHEGSNQWSKATVQPCLSTGKCRFFTADQFNIKSKKEGELQEIYFFFCDK